MAAPTVVLWLPPVRCAVAIWCADVGSLRQVPAGRTPRAAAAVAPVVAVVPRALGLAVFGAAPVGVATVALCLWLSGALDAAHGPVLLGLAVRLVARLLGLVLAKVWVATMVWATPAWLAGVVRVEGVGAWPLLPVAAHLPVATLLAMVLPLAALIVLHE